MLQTTNLNQRALMSHYVGESSPFTVLMEIVKGWTGQWQILRCTQCRIAPGTNWRELRSLPEIKRKLTMLGSMAKAGHTGTQGRGQLLGHNCGSKTALRKWGSTPSLRLNINQGRRGTPCSRAHAMPRFTAVITPKSAAISRQWAPAKVAKAA